MSFVDQIYHFYKYLEWDRPCKFIQSFLFLLFNIETIDERIVYHINVELKYIGQYEINNEYRSYNIYIIRNLTFFLCRPFSVLKTEETFTISRQLSARGEKFANGPGSVMIPSRVE